MKIALNAEHAEFYPGDDVVDIISRDMYPEAHDHTARQEEYAAMEQIPGEPKIVLIGESGVIPDVEELNRKQVGWSSYMTWSKDYCLTEKFNTFEVLKKVYDSPCAITKDELPELY